MKLLKSLKLGVAGLLLSCGAQATPINVGGVVWDPSSAYAPPALEDFFSSGSIVEDVARVPGATYTGFGITNNLNSFVANANVFCPGCELTFTFSMKLVSFIGAPNVAGGVDGNFTFSDLVIQFFVDHTPDYIGTMASAADGPLWLELTLHPDTFLSGIGTQLGSGSDRGTGSALLDATDGLAMGNFDTNKKSLGSDAVLSSSFQPAFGSNGQLLTGTFEITADTIPEPMPLAILGLGLLGLAASRRQAK